MPTRNVVLTEHQAVQVGLADSAAGRYTDFNASESLTKHLTSLATKAIASA